MSQLRGHHGSGDFQMMFFSVFITVLSFQGSESVTFTIINDCGYTVWPGILSSAGTPQLSTTGFTLQPGQSAVVSVPPSWSGRMWGRTLCAQNTTTGLFSCLTGDCGSSTVECSGKGGIPPTTLAEFTLDGANGLDFYDVSLVDGYNLPMLVTPQGGKGGNCSTTGCIEDLNVSCPRELQVDGDGESVACKSACEVFGDAQYCCSGSYSTPSTCKPSMYSEFFKSACPRAYSYAYDDGTSIFTCATADYIITFCPSTTPSIRAAGDNPVVATLPAGYVAPQASGAGLTRSRPPLTVYMALAVLTASLFWAHGYKPMKDLGVPKQMSIEKTLSARSGLCYSSLGARSGKLRSGSQSDPERIREVIRDEINQNIKDTWLSSD